jgi:transposase-like protein
MGKKGKWSADQKTEIVLANLRGEAGVSDIARAQEIAPSQIHSWKAEFLSAGQAALYPPIKKGYEVGLHKVRKILTELDLAVMPKVKPRREPNTAAELPKGRRVQMDATQVAYGSSKAWLYGVKILLPGLVRV